MNQRSLYTLVFALTLLFSACAPAVTQTPIPTEMPTIPTLEMAPTIMLTKEPVVATSAVPDQTRIETQAVPTTPSLTCATSFEERELKRPYQQQQKGTKRYTLSEESLKALFARMGIESMCIPVDMTPVFINADWDETNKTAQTGRMISLGFEPLYHGAGWSQGFLLASTYDIMAPTEYDRFAEMEDYDALKAGRLPNLAFNTFEANGIKGFQRVAAGIGMGLTPLYMTWVIPFEKGYVALVYPMGEFQGDISPVRAQLTAGRYPEAMKQEINRFTEIVKSIKMK